MSIKSKFCPSCGKNNPDLLDGQCIDCYFNINKIILPDKKNIRYCTVCKSVYWKGMWMKTSKKPIFYLEKLIGDSVKLPPNEKLKKIRIINLGNIGEYEVSVIIKSKLYKQNKTANITVTKYCCPICSREKATTYLAKIQIRPSDESENFIAEVMSFLKKYKKKISKTEDIGKGVDIYLNNKLFAKELARKLKYHFGCKMSTTASQYGWNRTKNKPNYRITILLRVR